MMRRFGMLVVFAGILSGFACQPGGLKQEDIKVDASNDPLQAPRDLLKRYANGQAPGSEVTSFEYMVNEVRKVDPARADVLKAGFDDIAKTPAKAKAKARELLDKIKPSMTP